MTPLEPLLQNVVHKIYYQKNIPAIIPKFILRAECIQVRLLNLVPWSLVARRYEKEKQLPRYTWEQSTCGQDPFSAWHNLSILVAQRTKVEV